MTTAAMATDSTGPRGRRRGLTEAAVAEIRRRDGPNILPTIRPPSKLRAFIAQLTHFFALMLWGAAVLAFVASMPQLGAAIAVVVVINGAFAYLQEARAERAAQELRDLLPHRARVIRDGVERDIDASELVTGDSVRLDAGDRVSADLVIVWSEGMFVDTSLLTGESVPIAPEPGTRVPAGSFVTSGEAICEVAATGSRTRLAEIAALTHSGERPRTPLARELDGLVRRISLIAVVVGVVFFTVAVALGEPFADGFVFAIGVTVALVPEGLLPTITLSLAVGAQRMADRHALVRRLDAVETLGATTVICTDKTGTLTRNEMSVVRVWTPEATATIVGDGYEPTGALTLTGSSGRGGRNGLGGRDAVARLAHAARVASTGRADFVDGRWVARGDPMEAAIDAFAHRCGVAIEEEVVAEHPFDPRRRLMSVEVRRPAARWLVVKGAPEALIERCIGDHAALLDEAIRLASLGLRVLAVAERIVAPPAGDGPSEREGLERELTVLGLLGFEDPPRTGTAAAIEHCRQLGVRVVMLTGDHPVTAAAIGRRIGLSGDDTPLVMGDDLPADDDELGRLMAIDGAIVSRASPEAKLRIARVLQERGDVVAMTGDGVNDGPALQAADVGVAMGRSGTDVAREAADLVLLDDEFATIVAAIESGRATYANIRRFLTYHLTDNVAELTPFVAWALSAGNIPLAIGVMQVLFLDIGTDLLPALALGAEPAHRQMDPIGGQRLLDRSVMRRAFGVLGPAEAVMSMLAFFTSMWFSGWRPGDSFPTGDALSTASGAAFTAIVLAQMANAFACRSTRQPVWAQTWSDNKILVAAVAAELAALMVFVGFPPLAELLDHRVPSTAGIVVALSAAAALVLIDAMDKTFRGRPSERVSR
ncbi:MAG: cation-translocating P-type ATPase [Acidimicrobiia bacterium]